jgi:hypothetical protein
VVDQKLVDYLIKIIRCHARLDRRSGPAHCLGSDAASDPHLLDDLRRLDVIASVTIRRWPAHVAWPLNGGRHFAWRRDGRRLDGHLAILLSRNRSKTTSNSADLMLFLTAFSGSRPGSNVEVIRPKGG